MSENTMTQFKTEGQPAFPVADKENENSSASSTDQTNTDQTNSSEGNKDQTQNQDGGEVDWSKYPPIHKHPRWIERDTEWKGKFNDQEKRHTDEISKLREEFIGKQGTAKANAGESKVPSWFGGDEQQWAEYQEYEKARLSQASKDALEQITAKQVEEQKAIESATSYMNEQIAEIESDKTINPEGTKVDRNKLLKFVLDNELVDTKGRWNYRAGFMMMKANVSQAKSESTKEKKQVASASTSENRGETKQSDYMTSADFSKPGARPW